jgi:putative DNA primase/helicase
LGRLHQGPRARGCWRELLPHFGIEERFLTGMNCPCPMCGGTDRFRFIDRKGRDGDGMWVCNQCQPKPRPAIELLMKFTGKPFKIVAREVDVLLGGVGDTWWRIKPPSPPKPEPPLTFGSYQRKVWNRGRRVEAGDVVDRYLRSRGVGMDLYPPCLRTSPLDWYRVNRLPNLTHHRRPILTLSNDEVGR